MMSTPPITAASCAIGAVHPLRRTGNLLQWGGGFWLMHCVSHLAFGIRLANAADSAGGIAPLANALLLLAAVWATGSGIIELADFLVRWSIGPSLERGEILSRSSMWVAGASALATVFAFLTYLASRECTGAWGGVAILGLCLSLALLGSGVQRAESLPRRLADGLLLAGAVPFPFIGLGLCLGSIAGALALAAAALAVTGVALIWLGRELAKL